MAYCIKCGQQSQDGAQFCLSCGAAIPVAPAQHRTHQAHSQQHNGHHHNGQHNNVHHNTSKPHSDAEANKGMAIIAYFLFFIPLLTGEYRKSPFVKYHTNQGTILFIFSASLAIAINILLAILRALFLNLFLWGLFGVFSVILNALWLVPTIFLILGIINAANGSIKPLPLIGDKFTIIK